MQIKSIGIDLGKTTFHLVALGTRSQVVVRGPAAAGAGTKENPRLPFATGSAGLAT
jgi:hypothetical protein